MTLQDHTHDAIAGPLVKVIAPVANVATYGGASSAIFFGLRADEFAAVAGLVVGLLGLALKWFYEHRRFRLEERHLEAMRRDAAERRES